MSPPTPKPFKIATPSSLLSFIQDRVSTSRIPSGVDLPKGEEWSLGVPPRIMEHIKEYWSTKYDWRAVEARINAHLKMFTLPIEEEGEEIVMHFVHHRSEREDAIPLLFQHGWPGSFLEVDKIIDSLTSPTDSTQQAYHVVAPSLPGFSFSSPSKNPNFTLKNIASINNNLMHALGYHVYIAQGGDWGSMISRFMGLGFPESCVAVHVNMLVAAPPSWLWSPFSFIRFLFYAIWAAKDPTSKLAKMIWWQKEESGYSDIQGTKPQTIAYALSDSPLGMLAWIRCKMHPLAEVDWVWEDEDVVTWAMMYILPPTASSAASIYTNAKGIKSTQFANYLLNQRLPPNVDFGASIFPKEIFNIPYFWAKASISSNIVFWKEHAKGGHFASVERPKELVDDIRVFTSRIRKRSLGSLRMAGKVKLV